MKKIVLASLFAVSLVMPLSAMPVGALTPEVQHNNYQTNTIWLADRSFLKLRNVEVYYNFAKCLLQKTKVVNAAKIYVRGTDLFCIDHLDVSDPESYGATNPLTRSVVVGLSVTF